MVRMLFSEFLHFKVVGVGFFYSQPINLAKNPLVNISEVGLDRKPFERDLDWRGAFFRASFDYKVLSK